jgi:tetratricopeptide (TPR) repeat protein
VTKVIVVALTAALFALPAGAAEPPCVARCHELATQGHLRAGVNEKGCVTSLCQEDGRTLYKNGEYDQALASLEVLAEPLGRSPSYRLDRALVYYALGRFDAALTDLDASLASLPDAFVAAAQRGHTLIRLHRLDDAHAQFSKLLESPGAAREFRGLRTRSYLVGNLGVIDVMRGDIAKAKPELQEALQVDGRNTQASTYIYRVLPQLDAGTIDRDGVSSFYAATEDAGLGDRKRAELEVAAVIEKYPKFAESYFLEAELLRNSHRYEDCERILSAGERAIPDEVDLKAERLRCALLKSGPTSAAAKPALAELKRLNATHPENPLVKEILHALDLL